MLVMAEACTLRRATTGDTDAISRSMSRLTARSIAPDCSPAGVAHLFKDMSPAAQSRRLRGNGVYCVAKHAGQAVGVAAIRPPVHLYRLFVAEAL